MPAILVASVPLTCYPAPPMVQFVHDFFQNVYNLPWLIQTGGMAILIAIVFAETGLLIGFFLPGDSLLVTAGVFAAAGKLDIVWLNITLILAAIIGDAVGYQIGLRTGPKIFSREDSFFFRRSHLLKTHEFYERHGGKTIILARFIPVIRTFAPVVAGVGTMGYARFAAYNIVGGISWVSSMTLLGYFLGKQDPHIDKHIHYVIAVVIFVSVLPAFWGVAKSYLGGDAPPAGPNVTPPTSAAGH